MADYLSRLIPDISALLFSYLEPEDVIRCQRLSKLWKIRSSEWMALYGLHLHWPDMSGGKTPRNEIEAGQQYKKFGDYTSSLYFKVQENSSNQEVPAEREFNFRHGRPEAVYRVTENEEPSLVYAGCLTAGDFLAWEKDDENIFWRRLSLGEDGSASPPETLYLGSGHDELGCGLIHLNKDGYVLVRSPDRFERVYRDIIYSLESQEAIWQHNHRWSRPLNTAPHPLHIGKECIYYETIDGTGSKIATYNFRTGSLLYERIFDRDSDYGEEFRRRAYIWELHGEEYTVREGYMCDERGDLETIAVINLTRGEMVHKRQYRAPALEVTCLARPGCSFAVTVWAGDVAYKDNFSQQSDGSFKSIARDYVLKPKYWRISIVDQPSRIVVGTNLSNMLGVGTLLELTDRDRELHHLKKRRPDLFCDAPADARFFRVVNTRDIPIASGYLYNGPHIVSERRLEFTMAYYRKRDDGMDHYSKYLCEFAPQATAYRTRLTLIYFDM